MDGWGMYVCMYVWGVGYDGRVVCFMEWIDGWGMYVCMGGGV